ncbi:GNAT family N-acetyltransferase [Actinopolyspora saharensis]|uniref:Putative hemolysin n=1 Tax=Actinopolyspora saharensis TaxID=995062 RepID=A0A1H1DS63_9ACTN|nr:GNAT family N-acyltransferase [Actinopolyspora saharensis]SDQ79352.1 Putative hemolysin [Actinopolyspora saharensis]
MAETGRSGSTVLASTGGSNRDGINRYSLHLTGEPSDVRAAQRLRHLVFSGEMGATVRGDAPGLEGDDFDEFCDHLIIRDDDSGEPVGTYRMLPPHRASAAGGLYSESEFDLARLDPIRPDTVETGRSCVHPDHRNGTVVGLMWAGIARYMLLHGHRWLAGCASVPLRDGGGTAAGVWSVVSRRYYAPEARRVRPYVPWRAQPGEQPERPGTPPLLRGYLRLGARVCGPPAHDREFGVADFFVLLDTETMDRRYLERFLGEAG